MKYEPCIRCADTKAAATIAEKLGWDGICVLLPPEMFSRIQKPSCSTGFSVGVEIQANKPSDISKAVSKFRKSVEVLAFRSSTAEMNRVVLETPEADLLTGSWQGGINHVLTDLAKENNVAICFELQPLMFSHGRQRTDTFQKMLECAKFVRKSKAPFAISSGAQSPMDIRDYGQLLSFGRLLGFQDDEINKSMSGGIVAENRKRLSGKWIMPGVEKV